MHKVNENDEVVGLGADLVENSPEWTSGDLTHSVGDIYNQFAGADASYDVGTQQHWTSASADAWANAPTGFHSSVSLKRAATQTVDVAVGATVDIAGPGASAVVFAGSTGALVIRDSVDFTGQVAGLSGSDTIDLADLPFNSATEATFLGNASGGTLTIADGTKTAKIALTGDYLSSTWTVSSDGHGGTDVVDPTVSTNWQTMKVGAGGFADGLDIDPDGTMVVRTDTNGAFIWNGTSWQQLVTSYSMPASFVAANPVESGEGVYEIQMAPSNSSIMYMSFEGNVFASTNKGATWTETSFAQVTEDPNDSYRMYGQKMAVDPNNPNIVYVGTPQNGLFVTTNGGKTWSLVSAVPVSGTTGGQYPGITGILFDPAIGGTVGGVTQTIFASSYGNGVYESTNGGSTWTHLSGGPTDVEYAAVSSTGAYYAVGDNGSTLWRYANGVWTLLLSQSLESVAINPLNPNEIVALSADSAMNVSYNGGATWTGINQQSPNLTSTDIPWLVKGNENSGGGVYLTTGGVAFSQTTPNELIVTSGTGAWNVKVPASGLTSSMQLTWSDMSTGIENLVAIDVLVPPGGAPVLASWDRPFFYISSLGAYPSTYGPVDSDNIVAGWSVDYASSTPSFLVGLADWWGTEESGYSTNGGQSWTPFATEIPGAGSSYMGGTIAASTPQNIIWAPANGNDPYYTLNGGQTWSPVSLPGVTSWSGFDWAYYLNCRTVTADRVLANTFYLYYNGVYETTNGGQSWKEVYSGSLTAGNYNSELMSVPGEAGNVFFTGGVQGDGTNPPSWASFYMSTNQGSSWTAVPNVLEVTTFGFGAAAPGSSYPTIYIVGYVNGVYGVWESTNKAASWTQMGTQPTGELDRIVTISGDMDTYGQVYVGFGGGGFAYLPAAAAATAPTVTGMTASPPTGLEIPGSTIVFTMNMSSTVNVTGTPTLSLNDGGTATYTGGSGSSALKFSYTVSSSDQDVANLAITSVNLPSGATISNGGVSAAMSGAIQTFPGLAIDPPMVDAISVSPSSGDLGAGSMVTFTLTMSEAVAVSGGQPTLTLNDGGTAWFSSGSGTNTLTFTYKVGAGQNTSSLSVTSINLAGASIVNGVGASASLSLSQISEAGPKIDTTPPTVTISSVGGNVSNPTQTITGAVDTADAGLAVTLLDGTKQVATVTSNATTGAWSAGVTLASGANSITARVVDGAGNSANSSAVVLNLIATTTTMSVAAYLANPSAADQQSGGVKILDTAANVLASIDILAADPHIASITLSDNGTLTLSAEQALDDSSLLAKFATKPTITVVDKAANLSLLTPVQIASLSSEGVTLIDATDQIVSLSLAQKEALGAGHIELQEPAPNGVTELMTFNSGGTVTSVTYSGVTGASYTSYTVYYGANWQILSASFSNGMVKTWSYNSDGSAVVSVTGITGRDYSSYSVDVSASKQIVSASFSDGMTQAYVYNSDGSYTITSTNVAHAAFTSSSIHYGSDGNPISATYNNGMTENWVYNSDGSYESVCSNIPGGTYSSYESLYNTSGSEFAIAETMSNKTGYAILYGDHLVTNIGSNQFSVSNGTDTFNLTKATTQTIDARTANSETFEFTTGFGQDLIKGLVPSGATHDVIQFSASMFSYLNSTMSQTADASALLSHAQQVGANVMITDSASDTLALMNTTIATLTANPSVFRFV